MEQQSQRTLAVILHADVVGSTHLVQRDESLAHDRFRDAFERFASVVEEYNGTAHEIRGDALVAEFSRASDAVAAAIAFQAANVAANARLGDDIRPSLRIGISLGEVVIANHTVTGAGVVLAQRLEQLSEPDGVVVQGTVSETVPARLPFEFESLGEQMLKGFEHPVRAFSTRLTEGASIPAPEAIAKPRGGWAPSTTNWQNRVVMLVVVLLVAAVGLYWALGRDANRSDLPAGPRIAVTPFENRGDESYNFFSEGLAQDIADALAKFSDLTVFPPKTSRTAGGTDCERVGKGLEADYIVLGSVLRSEDDVRISAQLLDAENCEQRWSETYDRELTAGKVFEVLDDVTDRIAGAIGSSEAPLWRREHLTGPESMAAYDCVLLSHFWGQNFDVSIHKEATECLEMAVAIDPTYSEAHAALASLYFNSDAYNYPHKRPDALELALVHIDKAITLNPKSERAHMTLAGVLRRRGDLDAFYLAAEKTVELNPNNALVLANLGTWMSMTGRWWDRGVELIERAQQLNPQLPTWTGYIACLGHHRRESYSDAAACILSLNLPRNPGIQATLAAAYGHLGEIEKARDVIDVILEVNPAFAKAPRAWFKRRWFPGELVESMMDGLRKAGFEVPPPTAE